MIDRQNRLLWLRFCRILPRQQWPRARLVDKIASVVALVIASMILMVMVFGICL